MNIDTPADLEFVVDDFADGAHETLDEEIRTVFRDPTLDELNRSAPFILAAIAAQSEGRLLTKYRNLLECQNLIDSKPWLRNMIFDGSKNSYKDLRLLKLLRSEPGSVDYEYSKHETFHEASAAIASWEREYVGGAADLLWDHIRQWFVEDRGISERDFYPRYSAVVQSSGMGKSRTVDELSKSHFVIPINLRAPHSSGYPPADSLAYDYLSKSVSQRDAFLRSCSLLHALFLQAARVLKGIKEEYFIDIEGGCFAEQFRNYMRKGMQYHAHGPLRQNFYAKVGECAERVYRTIYAVWFSRWHPSTKKEEALLFDNAFPLRKAFDELRMALEDELPTAERPQKQLKLDRKPRLSEHPFVVLAFDEAHTLTTWETSQDNDSWSRFGELRRALRSLKDKSLFTLFLSTSTALFSITPVPKRDTSGRILHDWYDVMLPFSDLGFDELAVIVNFAKMVKLSQVTCEEHLTSYGRPLWAGYHQSSDAQLAFAFAAFKLLGGVEYQSQDLSDQQRLACLAQRIPIEFLFAGYASEISDLEKNQVHSHMRVVLKIDDDFETMVTVSPSEPALSEAAYFVMSGEKFNAPQALQDILERFPVNAKGKLGKLVVALLWTLARDKAVGPADSKGRPPNNQRWCSLTKLLTSLFCTPPYASDDHVNVITSHGWRFTAKNIEQLNSTLGNTFKDSKVYFTHFIKFQEPALVSVEHLMCLMLRGAAVLCADDLPDVDGIIPFLLKGDEIRLDNIGVIMFQVRNDRSYTNEPEAYPFHDMNPRTMGVISPSADIPVIRIVFSLAAETPMLALMQHASAMNVKESYAAYDFWVAGLSPDLLVPVVNAEETWAGVSRASRRWEAIYSGTTMCDKLRRSMNPGIAVEKEFWENWCD